MLLQSFCFGRDSNILFPPQSLSSAIMKFPFLSFIFNLAFIMYSDSRIYNTSLHLEACAQVQKPNFLHLPLISRYPLLQTSLKSRQHTRQSGNLILRSLALTPSISNYLPQQMLHRLSCLRNLRVPISICSPKAISHRHPRKGAKHSQQYPAQSESSRSENSRRTSGP